MPSCSLESQAFFYAAEMHGKTEGKERLSRKERLFASLPSCRLFLCETVWLRIRETIWSLAMVVWIVS